MAPMKPINCSCGAVLMKATDNSMPIDEAIIIKCAKCGVLQRISVIINPQIKVELVQN